MLRRLLTWPLSKLRPGRMETFRDNHSVLDDLGAEVTGIAWPVSLCMAITIFLVRLLQASNDDEEAVRSVVIAEVIRESVRSSIQL